MAFLEKTTFLTNQNDASGEEDGMGGHNQPTRMQMAETTDDQKPLNQNFAAKVNNYKLV